MPQTVTVTINVSVENEDEPWVPGMSQQFGMRTRVYQFDVFEAANEWVNRGETTTLSALQLSQLWEDWSVRLSNAGIDWMARMHDALRNSGPPPPQTPELTTNVPEAEWEV